MTRSIYQKELIDLVNKYTSKIPRKHNIQKKYPIEYELLLKQTKFLPENSSITQRFWHITNNTTQIPLCQHCSKKNVKWHVAKKIGYVDYCSPTCASLATKTQEKRKQTCLTQYGFTSYSKTDEFKKILKTEKYRAVVNSKKTREKRKKTNLERYGVEEVFQSTKIREKIKQTNLKNFGVENPAILPEIISKIQNTIQKKYGVMHFNHTDKFKQTMNEYWCDDERMQASVVEFQKTMLKRYGVDHPGKMKTFKEKIKQSALKKYGVYHHTQKHIDISVWDKLNDDEWLIEHHHSQQKTLTLIATELGVHVSTVYDYCIKLNIEIKNYTFSTAEKEIIEYVKSILSDNIDIQLNNRNIISPYELDIYIPDHNLAIEYNGLFWHSELANKDEHYHLMKTEMCEVKGIRLIHIFEDEWRDQQQKCKDTLRHLFGKSPKGVYARNTIIKEIPWKQAKNFLNQYHLLGAGTPGNYRIGAFDKSNTLIGVMVFGIQNNEYGGNEIELKRFVTNKKNNPGLGSKMFKYAVKQKAYVEIVAFVDRRWFTGLVKSHIGFNLISVSKPALWWTDGINRHYRRFKTKKQLIDEGYDPKLSKRQIMQELGYSRIWDCGKLKLKWTNDRSCITG